MKNFLLLGLLIGSTMTVISAKKIKQAEYNLLLSECRSARDQIRSQCDFNKIRQQALQEFQQTASTIAERFTAMPGGQRSSAFQQSIQSGVSGLNADLAAMEVQHNLQVNTMIANKIFAYLQTVGTPTSRQLLADLIANKVTL